MSPANNPIIQYYDTKSPKIKVGKLNSYAFYLQYGYDMDSLFPLFPVYIFADCGVDSDKRKKDFIAYIENLDHPVVRAPGRYSGNLVERKIECKARIISISPDAVDNRNDADSGTLQRASSLLKKDLEGRNLYDFDYTEKESSWVSFSVEHNRNWRRPFDINFPVPKSQPSTDTISNTKILCYHITEEDYAKTSVRDVELLWSFPVVAGTR